MDTLDVNVHSKNRTDILVSTRLQWRSWYKDFSASTQSFFCFSLFHDKSFQCCKKTQQGKENAQINTLGKHRGKETVLALIPRRRGRRARLFLWKVRSLFASAFWFCARWRSTVRSFRSNLIRSADVHVEACVRGGSTHLRRVVGWVSPSVSARRRRLGVWQVN